MANIKNTKTHNIFLIDKNKLQGKTKLPFSKMEEIFAIIMSSDDNYELQKLKQDIDTKGFSVCLYFRGEEKYQSKLSSFCKTFVEDNQTAVTFIPRSASSVLFVWNDKHIYAVTTGQGFRMIEEYSFPKFGLIVASIFDERFKITSLDSNAMSSLIHSTKTVYSNEVDFIDVNALDTIFKEITGRLKDTEQVKKLLNLKSDSKRKSLKVTAKNYVQFSSALNFDGLLHLLTIIDGYEFENYDDRFNIITPMKEKKNITEIKRNNDAVIKAIYAALPAGNDNPFDFFNEDVIQYISANSYTIYDAATGVEYANCDDITNINVIRDAYRSFLNGRTDSLTMFHAFASSVYVRTKNEDSIITDGSLLNHVSGEIQVEGSNFFIFYGRYYRLGESYTTRLNDSLSGKLRNEFYTSEIATKWELGHDENWFNKEVSEKEDYIHLHRITPDYIEFADLMKYENDVVTLVHVKDGFNNDMRALDRQVELSIAKIMDIKHYNNDSYFRELYQKSSASKIGKKINSVFPSIDEFLACMKDKTIRYVIAIRPKNKDLLKNESNIAKHCLNALILRCFEQGIELRIQVL